MRRSVLFAGLLLAAPMGAGAHELVYFGTRTDGAQQGIHAARLDDRTGQLTGLGRVAEFARPTWLQAHPTLPVLYAVSEVGNDGKSEASVYSFAVDAGSGTLRELNHIAAGGGGATHLALDERSGTLFAALYGSGRVSAMSLRPDGGLGAVTSVAQHAGSGPQTPRQLGPHAHGVELDPRHRFVLSADLGADRVYIHRFNPRTRQLTPGDPPAAVTAPGTGPRHTAFHPGGKLLLLLTELSAEVQVYRWDGRHGRLQLLRSMAMASPGYTGTPSAAELLISRDGRFVYAASRSEHLLLVYTIDAQSGAMALIQRLPAGGQLPWALRFDPSGRWLLVANQGSNAVVVFGLDAATGHLTAPQSTLQVPNPSSIEFSPTATAATKRRR